MTQRQVIDRAERAERLAERYAQLETRRQQEGSFEEALEAHRLVLEQESAALYWRQRAEGAPV